MNHFKTTDERKWVEFEVSSKKYGKDQGYQGRESTRRVNKYIYNRCSVWICVELS